MLLPWAEFLSVGRGVSDGALRARVGAMEPGSACYLSYTSGTTGSPKAVMYSHDSVLFGMSAIFRKYEEEFRFGDAERGLSYMPLSHIAGAPHGV